MKKKLFTMLSIAAVAFAGAANAQEKYVAGGFEAAGHVVVGAGFQHQMKHAVNGAGAGVTNSEQTSYMGPMGRYLAAAPAPFADNFAFFVDSVELDLMKSFGENIRLRADLQFGRSAIGFSNTGAHIGTSGSPLQFDLEQAYATANIPAGNGLEFLMGRFNAPMGFESWDVTQNDLVSQTLLIRAGIRPVNLTGAKLYYAFSDLVDLHFWLANSITTDTWKPANQAIPSIGARLGFNWGEEGTQSTFGISPFASNEKGAAAGAAAANGNKDWSFGADLDLNWWITESFALGAEGLYRYDRKAGLNALGQVKNQQTFGGLLNLHYAFSDVWDGTLRYAFTRQNKGNAAGVPPGSAPLFGGGANGGGLDYFNVGGANYAMNNEISLGGGYMVADSARMGLELRYDFTKLQGSQNNQDFGAILTMAYNF